MIDETVLERRLTALEHAIADVKVRLNDQADAGNWIETIARCISDDEAFSEILAYGREVRDADRPQNPDSQIA